MRVAIDATPLTLSSGGLRRYTQELSLALAENFPQGEFFLVSDQPFEMPASPPPNLRQGGGPRNPLERRWWLWGLDRELQRVKAKIFHGTDFAVPYLPRRPAVMTVHDLSPWMDTAWHSNAGRVRRRAPLLIGLGLATMVITPSEAVRKQAIERFRIHPDRVRAIPHAASSGFRPRSDTDTSLQPRPPFFLYAGTLEPRKNMSGLLSAWREVRRLHPVDLVLAGRLRSDFAQLAPEPGLRIMGEVSDERLAQLFAGALAFVYPSFYEGFGLPVLEAMQCGACVITSRDPAITEVAAGAALAAGSHAELVHAMLDIAAHPERADPWRRRALRRASDFSWRRTAQLACEVYEEAQRRFSY
jgi:alpha-1,3-rhamnosyl/mannosyltransferase